jgi:sigma-B regulation protein RsbU (phosphoserine phosphatase)
VTSSGGVVQAYRLALEQLRSSAPQAPPLERMSELVALLELTTTLDARPADAGALGEALAVVAREVGAPRGALFVRDAAGKLALRATCGRPSVPSSLDVPLPTLVAPLGPGHEAFDRDGLALLVPIRRRGEPIAAIVLGSREGGREYGADQHAFLARAAECAAASIEHGRVREELQRANQKLSVKVFQLHDLFEISRELSSRSAEDGIVDLLSMTVMGHFMVSRCALYRLGPHGLDLDGERGLPAAAAGKPIPPDEARAALDALTGPTAVAGLPDGPLRRRLERARLVLAVPLAAGPHPDGVLAIGERASGRAFSEEDRDFAQTLARQACGALENARLSRVREEKQRQDRELQIAREIQQSLFPARPPEVPGFDVAGASRPCQEVGGDAYDWIDLGDGRLALAVADVAGKGTPASLLMASVHASVQALAGTASPGQLAERVNRFLFANTQAGRYATLFYAELDAASRRLTYVTAGHVPPYHVDRRGRVSRLTDGGIAPGLVDEARYEVGEVTLEPGELVAVVTDGVTEAATPDERFFGDDGVCRALLRLSGDSAESVVQGLIAAVSDWVGTAGCGDDLTALVVKAR